MCISPPARKDNNPLSRLLRSSGISSGLRARLTLLLILPLSMSGSLVRWLLTWLWLISVVMPFRGHVFAGVPRGNINLVSIPAISSNLFSLPPRTEAFPAQSGFFYFALYITKVALKGRVVLENPDQVGDPSAAQVTQIVGIILPFLLHNSVQIAGGKGSAPVSQALYQLRLPVLDRINTTAETCVLPPISLPLSFFVPVSASRAPRAPSQASSCSYVIGRRKLVKKVAAEKYLRVGTTFS